MLTGASMQPVDLAISNIRSALKNSDFSLSSWKPLSSIEGIAYHGLELVINHARTFQFRTEQNNELSYIGRALRHVARLIDVKPGSDKHVL